ncbi:MAG: beta-lactamase family protein, partial [Bacteroidetes bacterium]|nr:beta-lactamase family protein [Bacteroidota bacterium]
TVAVLFGALLLAQQGVQNTQPVLSKEQHDGILGALKEVHEKQRNVGLSAAVLLGGTLVFSEGLGYADLERKIPVSTTTRFPVASVTKAFTGAALVKLYETEKIDLDAPIQRYVPAFPKKHAREITPRLLAGHLAGIRSYVGGERDSSFFARHYTDVVDALGLFENDTLLFAPGSKYSYTSYGYNLLAAAIQSVSGRSYREYVEETILRPLRLNQTEFENVRQVIPERTENYSFYHYFSYKESPDVMKVPRLDYSYNMGGGNIITTAEDLVRFGQAIVRPGFFTRESLDLFYARIRHGDVESPWSFGWFVADDSGERRIHITGAFAGTQAALWVYPESDLVIAVISNTWGINSRSNEMVIDLPKRIASIVVETRKQ